MRLNKSESELHEDGGLRILRDAASAFDYKGVASQLAVPDVIAANSAGQ